MINSVDSVMENGFLAKGWKEQLGAVKICFRTSEMESSASMSKTLTMSRSVRTLSLIELGPGFH